ncbi:MAG: 4-hydroxy-3-methylbut-2-enyl diphosphate reductase [Planctomycetota bacterium]|nr:MAG: 4-hydroxy-3-methylbut-2-enyl diphosphate reductase [Planctomycetota bacterium]
MRILLASPRGFCAGVNMAITCLEECIRVFGTSIFVYHEIVHNKYVVERFIREGVRFVNSIDEVPIGSVLLFSAHGVSPEIRHNARARNLKTIDATCPLVTKVHLEAIKYANEGFHIILIGHEGHDEVIGTMGEAPQSITLVESAAEVANLKYPKEARLAYLTQTTLSVEEAEQVISALEAHFPGIEHPPKEDICYATTNRQFAVHELIQQADLLIVLGSQNSSNSRRLQEIGLQTNKPAYLIDGAAELREEWFDGVETVTVTAGASAPEVVVEETIDWIKNRFGATTEEVVTREENVHFQLPRELRVLQGPRT